MRITVLGLWHQGTVTAASLASLGHHVVAVDLDAQRMAELAAGIAPVFEPGLEDLLKSGLASGRLRLESSLAEPLADTDIVWIAYDARIYETGNLDAEQLIGNISAVLPRVPAACWVLISAQLPVGTMRYLERSFAGAHGGTLPRIAYLPENLRLGPALSDFLHPDRLIVGVRARVDTATLEALLHSITPNIEWMSPESAEMTKHAINAFLAMSVVFANEIASICETVGADAKAVERGLKTEGRIGRRAYVAPGAAFAGGTLERDVAALNRTACERAVAAPLLASILVSNREHQNWIRKKLTMIYGDLSRVTIAVWGLTYKPDTDTLRRSASVPLCDWLLFEGAQVHVHDPKVKDLPERWRGKVRRVEDPVAALAGADALVMATEWPVYRTVPVDQLMSGRERLVVLDANRFLPSWRGAAPALEYFSVGMPHGAS